MCTIEDLYARLVYASRRDDLIEATHAILHERLDDPTARYLYGCLWGYEHAAEDVCEQVLGDQEPHLLIPAWECDTCGCTDRYDIYGEIGCGCDSCSKSGCESSVSRFARGCKRSRDMHEAGLAFGAVAKRLVFTPYHLQKAVVFRNSPPYMEELRKFQEAANFLSSLRMPPYIEEFKKDCIHLIRTSNPRMYEKIRYGHTFLTKGPSQS